MTDEPKTASSDTLGYERAESFFSTYANNFFFEPSAWDLKIIFAQLEQDQVSGNTIAKQHLAVTIPWAQAKLALFYLRLQVEALELQIGKIGIRKDLLPIEAAPLTPEQESIPGSKEFRDLYIKRREEFLAML